MRGVFYGQPGDLAIGELLTREEQAILRKLGVASRADIGAYVQQRGCIWRPSISAQPASARCSWARRRTATEAAEAAIR